MTPSKGFHYLFYVDAEQREQITGDPISMKYNDIIYNIDVKFKNGLLNCEPSQITNYGSYRWTNPESLANIPQLPDIIYNVILSNVSKSKPEPKTKEYKIYEPVYVPEVIKSGYDEEDLKK